jgi:hypothetical protein
MADKASGLGRVIVLVGITSFVVTPAAASVEQQRARLQSRVEAVRQALRPLHQAPPAALDGATLTAQAANWNNWPKWSKWSNWANQ